MKKKNKQMPVTSITDKLQSIRLADNEVHELRALQKNCDAIKHDVGALEVEYLTQKALLLKKYDEANSSLTSRCGTIARAHGIDLNNGNWSFELETQALTKVG